MRLTFLLGSLILALEPCVCAHFPGIGNGDKQINQYFNSSTSAKGRLLAITVPQEPCKSSGTGTTAEAGVCYPKKLCQKNGGTIINTGSGICGPVGSCCLFTFKPVANARAFTVQEKISTIIPNLDFASNIFSFPKMAGYCQLKVEFVEFTYQPTVPPMPPTGEGRLNGLSTCTTDILTFSGSVTVSSERFVICGPVPFERPFYLSYGSSGENIRMNFRSTRTPRSSFKLRVTQIGCDSEERVDDHCLLQYNEGSGQVESFGYGSYQISPQEYSVCIGNPTNSNVGRWSMCTPTPAGNNVVSPFYLSTYFGPGVNPGTPNTRKLVGGFTDQTCDKTSYISIAHRDKFCGAFFPTTRAGTGSSSNILSVRFQADEIDEFTAAGTMNLVTIQQIDPLMPIICGPTATPPQVSLSDPATAAMNPIFTTCTTVGTNPNLCSCTVERTAAGALKTQPAAGLATGFCLEYS